jgi:signal peptidase I
MSSAALWLSKSHALKCELAAEVLRSTGQLRLQVVGCSMLPTIRPGDVLLIDRARAEEVSVGDIVMFGRDRRLVVHRVVKSDLKHSAIVTQGDAMPLPDPPFAPSDLQGKVKFILRNGRCIEPRRTLRVSERAVAALVQHSEIAARVVVGIHVMFQASESQALQLPDSQMRPSSE